MFDDYISLAEVLKECGCCKRTIERWQAKANFPRAFQTPMGWVFSKKRIADWLKERERKARNKII